MKHIDVSKNKNLVEIHVRSDDLIALDITQNTSLKELYVRAPEMTLLDLDSVNTIEQLTIYKSSLTDIDLSKLKMLKGLTIWDSPLQMLDLSNNKRMNSTWSLRGEKQIKVIEDKDVASMLWCGLECLKGELNHITEMNHFGESIGINFIYQLITYTEDELNEISTLNDQEMIELKDALKFYGLSLGTDPEVVSKYLKVLKKRRGE